MKKLIPVYLLLAALVAVVYIVGGQLTREVKGLRSDLARVTNQTAVREPRGMPRIRVTVADPVYVER